MDDRLAKELRCAIDRHSQTPQVRELWLRLLGLQLLADDLEQQAQERSEDSSDPPTPPP